MGHAICFEQVTIRRMDEVIEVLPCTDRRRGTFFLPSARGMGKSAFISEVGPKGSAEDRAAKLCFDQLFSGYHALDLSLGVLDKGSEKENPPSRLAQLIYTCLCGMRSESLPVREPIKR